MLQRTVFKRVIPVLLGAAAVVALVQTIGTPAFDALTYRRDAVLAGEVWRLATGPWVHLSWAHALLNLGGLALVLAMFTPVITPVRQGWLLVAIGLATSSCLLLWPRIDWMVGLSGPLHGLFAADALALTARRDARPAGAWWRGPRYGWVLLAGLALKLALELAWRGPVQTGPSGGLGGPVLIEAHWAGTAAGLLVYAGWRAYSAQCAITPQSEGAERK